MTKRLAYLLITVVIAALASTSTGAFTVVESDRHLDVAVVDDNEAYLGVTPHDVQITSGPPKPVTLLSVQNNAGEPLTDVTVTLADDQPTPPNPLQIDYPSSLDVGEQRSVTARVNCDSGSGPTPTEQWVVTVQASSPDTALTIERTVTVTCEKNTHPQANTTAPDPPAEPAT